MWNNSNGMVNDDTTNQKQLEQKVAELHLDFGHGHIYRTL